MQTLGYHLPSQNAHFSKIPSGFMSMVKSESRSGSVFIHTGPCPQKDPALDKVLCCHHLEIVDDA